MSNTGLSIFFPCYNDGRTIGRLIQQSIETVSTITTNWEIIVVDDGSTDQSNSILRAAARSNSRVRVITHKQNRGYGAALRSGFRAATKELIFYTDGDGQYDPKELPLLMMLVNADTDFVNGIKLTRMDPLYRVVIGNFYNFFVRWIFWLPIQDVDCDFRLIRKSISQKMTLCSNSGAICVELVKQAQRAGARFREVSVHHYDRQSGKSQFFRPKQIAQTMYELMNLWIRLMVYYHYAET